MEFVMYEFIRSQLYTPNSKGQECHYKSQHFQHVTPSLRAAGLNIMSLGL